MDRYCPLKMNAASSAVCVYTAVDSVQLLKFALLSITSRSGLRIELTSFPLSMLWLPNFIDRFLCATAASG